MSFFKKLFGGSDNEKEEHTDFQEGDIFYTNTEGKFQIYKLLKYENEFETFHVKAYEDVNDLPHPNEIKHLKVEIHHFPIAKTGFKNPKFLANKEITNHDLLGYFEYIKQTQNINELVKYAKKFYQEAYSLSEQKDHQGAIQNYAKAVELIPNFFEAIDNMAFSYMDMGKWQEAIEAFKQSLQVNPDSFLAIFSIGECHIRLQEYPKAKDYFEKALQIDPTHEMARDYLSLALKAMNQ